jgi:hypothetical protein
MRPDTTIGATTLPDTVRIERNGAADVSRPTMSREAWIHLCVASSNMFPLRHEIDGITAVSDSTIGNDFIPKQGTLDGGIGGPKKCACPFVWSLLVPLVRTSAQRI